jgi:hypothetical protein
VRIQGYRCLKDVDIWFDRITTFIGPTGVGKSSVLRALDWFFNGRSSSSPLLEEDVWAGEGSAGVSVEVEFGDLTDLDRIALGKYAEGVDSVCLWRRWEGGVEKLSGFARVYPLFAEFRAAKSAGEKKQVYNRLRAELPDLALPAYRNAPDAEAALASWEANHPSELVTTDVAVDNHFFGFAGQAKMSGLFDYVFVNVDLRASEEGRDAKSSVLGRILEQAVNREAADEELAEVAEIFSSQRGRIQESHFGEQLETISGRLTTAVAQFTSGRSVHVSPVIPELKLPQIQFDVAVNDGKASTRIDRQGHGFQRALLIAALQLLAESHANASGRTIFLSIEEPELFQHPVQARAFASVLRKIAQEADHDVQIAYATHSPYFLEPDSFTEVRRMTRNRNEDQVPSVSVKSATRDAVCDRLIDIRRPEQVRKHLSKVFLQYVPEALFARSVVIVEGPTDRAIFEGCALRDSRLDVNGVVVVDAIGKGMIPTIHALLAEFGVPSFAVFDGDEGCEARARSKDPRGEKSEEIAKERQKQAEENRRLLKYFQADQIEDFPQTAVLESCAVVEDTLETLLLAEWPEWNGTRQQLIAEGRGIDGKDATTYRQAALETAKEPPAWVSEIIATSIQLGLDN